MENANTGIDLKKARIAFCGKQLVGIWQQKALYLFLLPAIVFTLIFSYRPMYGVIMAFQHYDIVKGLWGSNFIGLDNFKNFFTDSAFYHALRNTVAMSFLNFIFGFPAPIIFAILINELSWTRFKRIVQSITYLPHFISWVVVAGLLYRMLEQDTGIVNILLHNLGFEKIGFFREPKYFWGIYVTSGIWKEVGWGSILYLSAMTAINPELYEAAFADGAGRFRRIWHITLPGIAPTVVMLLILSISGFFSGSFDAIFPLRNPMISETSDVIDVYSYFRGIRMGDYGYATAIGVAQALVAFMLLYLGNKGAKRFTEYSLF